MRRLTKKKLYNLGAGKASNIEEFMLSSKTNAENLRKSCINEFIYQRFERLIEKRNFYAIASESGNTKFVILFHKISVSIKCCILPTSSQYKRGAQAPHSPLSTFDALTE